MTRFNLWIVNRDAAAVIAFGERQEMESLAETAMLRDAMAPTFPRLDLRVLPDGSEP